MQPQFNPQKIKLIIGLGNPGREYQNTYHNAGYLFVDFLNRTHRTNWSNWTYRICKTDTFMNESGGFVRTMLKKYNVKPENSLIVHDDSDIALGQFKLNFGRGSAGHKGVESVIKALETRNFWRLRIGVRPIRPIGPIGLIGLIRRTKAGAFVLKKISIRDKKILEETFQEIKEEILLH